MLTKEKLLIMLGRARDAKHGAESCSCDSCQKLAHHLSIMHSTLCLVAGESRGADKIARELVDVCNRKLGLPKDPELGVRDDLGSPCQQSPTPTEEFPLTPLQQGVPLTPTQIEERLKVLDAAIGLPCTCTDITRAGQCYMDAKMAGFARTGLGWALGDAYNLDKTIASALAKIEHTRKHLAEDPDAPQNIFRQLVAAMGS